MPQAKAANNEHRMVHVRIDSELHRRLRIIVAARDTSIQDWLAITVEREVAKLWPVLSEEELSK